jgi:signal transduction histidine kinase
LVLYLGYDIKVRSSDSPYLADWFAVSLRWLSLLGMLAGLSMHGQVQILNIVMILAGALWNISITILATLNRRLPFHRPLNLLADITFCLFLFHINGGFFGLLPWSCVLPLFTAAIYYEIRGGVWVGVLISGLQIGLTYLYGGINFSPLIFTVLTSFNLILGVSMGLVSRQLMGQIRVIYYEQVRQRKEVERRVMMAERNRMQTFMSMVETLSSTMDYRVVLDSVLDLCATAIGGDEQGAGEMISTVLLFGEHDLRVEAARHFSPQDLKQTFPAETGVLRDALQTAETCQIQNPDSDPELNRIVAVKNCKSALVVPLHRGNNAYGMVFFGHPNPDFFTVDRVELLEMIGHQAVIAIQNARLYQDLGKEKERIVMSQEEARKKLARDLHDGPIQSVAAIAMRVDVARHMMIKDVSSAGNELAKIEELARRTTKELRHMLFTLRPLALETDGLISALQTMAEKTLETYAQKVRIEVDQFAVDQLELGKQTVIFYLVEEAVTNARKHALATMILVRLRMLPQDVGIVLLEIIDNGKGFDVAEVMTSYEKRGSLGMINLRERSELINGVLDMQSALGKGTRIRVFIPLNEEASDRLQLGKIAQPG